MITACCNFVTLSASSHKHLFNHFSSGVFIFSFLVCASLSLSLSLIVLVLGKC